LTQRPDPGLAAAKNTSFLPLPQNCRDVFMSPSRVASISLVKRVEGRRNDMQHEREIDALLSDEVSGSIIDRLLTLPRPGSQSGNEWDRAVASRFEAQLARRLRTLLDQPGEGRETAA
jgi:hypothetical protein